MTRSGKVRSRTMGHRMSVRHPPPRRRRPTQRDYAIRRIGALALASLLVVLLVSLARAVGGGGDGEASADDTPSTQTVVVEGSAGPTSSAVAVTEPTLAPTTSIRSGPHVPTAEDPAIVYVAGDSDAGAFGPYLETLMKQTGVARVTLDYVVSSGLARPDFFDWPANFRAKLPRVNPDIVIVTFGGNDAQPIKGNAVDSAGWRTEYGKRVGETMDLLAAEGRTLVWVGIPNASDPATTARMKVQDEVVRSAVAEHPGVIFIDTWKRFSGRDGGFAEYVIDPRDNEGKDVRAKDGFHLNTTGAEILALDIAEVVRADLRTRGATI